MNSERLRIGIIGGGPSGLFLFKEILEKRHSVSCVTIFEASNRLGQGMPYSRAGAGFEHVTNVSSNEIPHLPMSISEWVKTLDLETLAQYKFSSPDISDYKVLPRLLFGDYLAAQFDILLKRALELGMPTEVQFNTLVLDVRDDCPEDSVTVVTNRGIESSFDKVILCTGHRWPHSNEERIPGYFDSPYPPKKINKTLNHPVAIRGSSLTAIDAVRTISRANGKFSNLSPTSLSYERNADSPDFKIVMHSREGFLPAVRFHLEDSHLGKTMLVSDQGLDAHKKDNGGFISLDFIFENNFKEGFRAEEPQFYDFIKHMSIESFVETMMKERERAEPFSYLRMEYEESRQSIRNKESIYWKEKLAILSFSTNYPAKYFSAEDWLRLQKVLMPLISLVIAFIPQSSCEELMALHQEGCLEILSTGSSSTFEPRPEGGVVFHHGDAGEKGDTTFETFIDCIGQPHLSFEEFPFATLVKQKVVAPARIQFRSRERAAELKRGGIEKVGQDTNGDYYLTVPGVAIGDAFQAIDDSGTESRRVFIMAVSLIGGYNPDYSGLDFCEEASQRIVARL